MYSYNKMAYMIDISAENYSRAHRWCSENISYDREWSSHNAELSPKTPWGWDSRNQLDLSSNRSKNIVFLFLRKTDALRFKLMGF